MRKRKEIPQWFHSSGWNKKCRWKRQLDVNDIFASYPINVMWYQNSSTQHCGQIMIFFNAQAPCQRGLTTMISLLDGTYPKMAARQGRGWGLLPVSLLIVPVGGDALHWVCTQINHSLELGLLFLLGQGVWCFIIHWGRKIENLC